MLEDKVAIVTGAGGSGCGRAIACRFARQGASVVIADTNEAEMRETASAIKAEGTKPQDKPRKTEMRLRTFASLILVALIAAALSAFSAIASHREVAQNPDPISGDWDVSFTLQATTVAGTFKLKLDGDKVTGTVESAHTGPGTLSKGSWVDNKLSCTLDFKTHDSIDVTGSLKDGKLVGEFRTEGMQGTWEAKRTAAPMPQSTATPTPTPVVSGAQPVVSPDGARIAFLSNRGGSEDLFVINADGTGETQLTHTPEAETGLQWSADGKQILFSILANDASRLYAIDPDGKNQREIAGVPGRTPMLSSDGKRVVYMAGTWTATRLMVAALDGSGAKQINDGSSIAWNNHWSPDGKRIAFTGQNDPKSELAVFVMNADGSDRRQVTHIAHEEGGAQWPVWSPNGRQLAVQVNSRTQKGTAHIWIVDAATGAARKLAAHDQTYLDETPSWFPDGQRIAFQSNRTGQMEVWVMNADASAQRQVTGVKQRPASPPLVSGGDPRVSPDGSRILFSSNRTGVSQLYLMNADGSDVRQITNESSGAYSANWSPDGKRIVYIASGAANVDQIVIMNADGTQRRTISEVKGNQSPAWSPDGSKILFAAGAFPNINIYTMNADGSGRRNISPNPGFDYDPAWSTDGKTIALVTAIRGQGPRVWVMNADGSGRKRITNSPDAEERPAWSPDGRNLAFQASKRGGGPHEAYVHVVEINSGTDQRLGSHDTPYLDETPSWFPDGKRIAFQSNRTGRMEVWVMNVDGSAQRQVTGAR